MDTARRSARVDQGRSTLGTGAALAQPRPVHSRESVAQRRTRLLHRYLLDPPARLVVRLGLAPGTVVVETTGRRTGRRRRTVVGALRDGRVLWIVAEHGPRAGYVANFVAEPRVRVLLDRRWRSATARLDTATDPESLLDSWPRPGHARAVRRFGSDLRAVRIELDDAT
jgi:deazaflavin-dependent oxidoreductase (nitroreductase family)